MSLFNHLNEGTNATLEPTYNEGWNFDISGNMTAMPRISSGEAGDSTHGVSLITSKIGTISSGQLLNPRQVSTSTVTTTVINVSTATTSIHSTITPFEGGTTTATQAVAHSFTTTSTLTKARHASPTSPTPGNAGGLASVYFDNENINGDQTIIVSGGPTISPANSANSAKVIAPAVVAGFLGVLLLIFSGYFLVRRRAKRASKKRSEGKRQEELIDAWDARPMPAQTNSVQDIQIPRRRDPDSKRLPNLPIETSTSLGPATVSSNEVILDGETPSRRERGLATAPLANLQTIDDQDEPTHRSPGSIGQARMLEAGASDPAGSGQANVMISSESRAEIQSVIASRPEHPSVQQQRGWSLRTDRVLSTSTHETAPPEYRE